MKRMPSKKVPWAAEAETRLPVAGRANTMEDDDDAASVNEQPDAQC